MFVVVVLLNVVLIGFLLWPRGDDGEQANPGPGQIDSLKPGEWPIEHVVFLIKENRTFDHYFGQYPGAEGVTTGFRMQRDADGAWVDGPEVPLELAPYIQPHDITHGFSSGLYSINGGKMNGFNIIGAGSDMSGYVQHTRDTLPNYWKLADRFVLADHFFTSMYGPTFPEHLYTVAAQSNGVIDNKTNNDTVGSYCDDPLEYTKRFPLEDLAGDDISTDHGPRGEHHRLDPQPAARDRRVLGGHPHVLRHPGPARPAREEGHLLEVLRPARSVDERVAGDRPRVERADARQHPGPRPDPHRPRERRAAGGLLARPARGLLERAPGRRHERLRR